MTLDLHLKNDESATVFSSPTRKTIMMLDSVALDLWTEKAGNHAYIENILNRITIKRAQGKQYRLVKKLKPVDSDPEESHL